MSKRAKAVLEDLEATGLKRGSYHKYVAARVVAPRSFLKCHTPKNEMMGRQAVWVTDGDEIITRRPDVRDLDAALILTVNRLFGHGLCSGVALNMPTGNVGGFLHPQGLEIGLRQGAFEI